MPVVHRIAKSSVRDVIGSEGKSLDLEFDGTVWRRRELRFEQPGVFQIEFMNKEVEWHGIFIVDFVHAHPMYWVAVQTIQGFDRFKKPAFPAFLAAGAQRKKPATFYVAGSSVPFRQIW